ncbi:autotransporter outer membrane beta-barrel domain-containing protein [Bordetella sp. LUAb4]|uniref:autotransporter outer membrane beta-barrel domain-containing protein n=1 Tax=Bordetella sp. LUAb4 TaxID=2843195 RepID=UPI001E4FCF30|nr:autotransporter outer membrane beta-barrel domain-containing protein [Bordetella sp. LUAb4]
MPAAAAQAQSGITVNNNYAISQSAVDGSGYIFGLWENQVGATAPTGGSTTNGISITNTASITVNASSQVVSGAAIWAADQGGNSVDSGAPNYGGPGGSSSGVTITSSDNNLNATAAGSTGFAIIQGVSNGGNGSNWGGGGNGGPVQVTLNQAARLWWTWQNAGSGNGGVYGIQALSTGGQGGGTNTQSSNNNAGWGGNGGAASVNLSYYGDLYINVYGTPPSNQPGLPSAAVLAASVGGNAGSAIQGNGNSGGQGGSAGLVTITHADSSITTNTDYLPGFVAYGAGGAGGFGGTPSSQQGGDSNPSQNGGNGGSTSGAVISFNAQNRYASISTQSYGAGFSPAIAATQIGGAGGYGGYSHDKGASASHGGDGGSGGNAGPITITVQGNSGNYVGLTTDAPSSPGIYASSLGGAGAYGGEGDTSAAGNAHGGQGGAGGAGGDISVSLMQTIITTNHSNSPGIVARSEGGIGGQGGYADAGTGKAYGGGGGNGGNSGNITITTDSASSITTTYGTDSMGIFAQSLSAAGGDNNGNNGGFGGDAGNAGVGGNVGTITINNGAKISTAGPTSRGMLVQALAGAGGTGGDSWKLGHSGGGSGAAGGAAGTINVTNRGAISTAGDSAQGILLQSIGGGGGAGGSGSGIISAVGGNGGNGSDGGAINFTNSGAVTTTAAGGIGVLGQSIGGGGGDGGGASAISVAIGGTGGNSANGGVITANLNSGTNVKTVGDIAHGVVFQSIGGGGGNGGNAVATGITVTEAIGGSGGAAGIGGAVTINTNGANITTSGNKSVGLVAQSIGGGGGTGGSATSTSVGPAFAVSLAVGGTGGSAPSYGGIVGINMTGGSISTGQSASLINGSSAATGICPGTSNGACNVQPVDSHGVVVQSIGGGGGHGGAASAQAIAVATPIEPDGSQLSLQESMAVGGKGGGGGNGGVAMFAMSNGAKIVTAGNGASGAIVQSIGGGGGNGGDSSAMSAAVGYTSDSAPTGLAPGVSLTATVSGNGGSAGAGGAVQVVMGGGTDQWGGFWSDGTGAPPTSITTYGDYATGIKAQSIGGGGGDAGTGSGNTQNFGTGSTTSLSINLGSEGSPGGNGGDTTIYLYPGNGIQTYGSAAVGVIAQSIGGGGGTSQGGSFSVAQSFKQDGSPTQKPGMNVSMGNKTSKNGGSGQTVTVSVAAPITTHGNDSTGVVAQSIGGGGGIGGSSASDGSGDNPVLQAMQGREFTSDVTSWLNDGSTPQENSTMNINIGGTGGAGGDGGPVTVWLAAQISTLGNPVVAGGNQSASSGDWAHGIVAQSIGGGGGKGGTAIASSQGGDWAEINSSYNVAVGGAGGSGGSGGTVTVNLQDGGAVQTVGYGATGVVAQSIGGGGGLGADGSDALGGRISLGRSDGGNGGSGGSGGNVFIQEDGNLGSTISTAGTFADGINAQSIGGGGGIAGAGSSVWAEYGSKQVSGSMALTAGGGTASSGSGANVYINQNFQNYPLYVSVSGYGAYGILAQSIGGGGGNIIANQAASGGTTTQLGSLGTTSAASGGGVYVNLTSGSVINASGVAGMGLVAQSVGGGGGIIRVNDGSNTTPGLFTGYQPTFSSQNGASSANGGPIVINSYANISANGPGGIGIFAQSVGGGGGLILNGSTLYAGAPLANGCSKSSCGGTSTNGSDNFSVTLLGGSVSATGTNGIGIFAQATGFAQIVNATPNVVIGNGTPSNIVTVTGGSGSGAAGVWIDRPAGDSNDSQGWLKVQEGGVLTTVLGSGGLAVNATGGGSVAVSNLGTITGSMSLDTTETNYDGGSWNPGPVDSNGMLQSERGSLLNRGTWVPGASARADVLNQGTIAFDDPKMTTTVSGRFIQTSTGSLSPVIDSLNNRTSLFKVNGTASVDGLIAPNAVSLLPGTVPVFTATNFATTAQARDSLVFDWDAKTSGNTITLTPARVNFTPDKVSLNSSQSSLANYYNRGWNNTDRGLAVAFAGISHIDDARSYRKALDNLSSKATQAQSMAVIESAGTILGAGMSCPVFIGDGVQLSEDNCVWGQVNGRWTDQSSTSDISGYHVSGTTYRVGGQHQVAPNWFVGGSLAAGQTYARTKGGSSGDGDVYDGSITLKRVAGPWYFAGSLAMATGSFDNNRRVNFFGDSSSLGSSSNIFLAGTRLRTGYEFNRGDWYIKPYGDVDVVYTHAPGFKEGGASPYALNVRSASQTNVAFSPMIEFGRRTEVDAKTSMRAYAAFGVSWRPDNTRTVRSSFAGADAGTGTFTDHIKSPEVLGKVDLGLQFFRAGGYEFRAGYTADFAHSFLSQSATARFAYHF